MPNVWGDEWEFKGEEDWTGGAWSTRLPRGERLGATVYELQPGTTGGLYHFHHGAEELLIVLRGRPTLRTPEGERELDEGEVVHFRTGPEGAHQVKNSGSEPVRYLMASTFTSPEVVEYPDQGLISSMARTDSQHGRRLWTIRELEPPGD